MNLHAGFLFCATASLLLPGGIHPQVGSAVPRTTGGFEKLSLHVEIDLPPLGSGAWEEIQHTGDLRRLPAELVLDVECERPLSSLRMVDASGTTRFELATVPSPSAGMAEISIECAETPLFEILRDFPSGAYGIIGRTTDGRPVEGTVSLVHRFPGLYAVVRPLPGASLSAEHATIAWSRARGAVRYRLEVEDDAGFGIEMVVPASSTSVTLPPGLLQADTEYEYSLVAEGDTDNELEFEGTFLVRE